MVLAKGLRKTYRKAGIDIPALRSIDLRVEPGEAVAIMGPSGSGKTTLLNILGLLDRPDEGTYEIRGKDLLTLSDREASEWRGRHIGFVFQSFNLLPELTAWQNVALPMRYARVPPAKRRAKALAILEELGLGDRAQHRPAELSAGQEQRVALARALVTEPALVLADEPTGNLDTETQGEVLDLLFGVTEKGVTLIVVTHDPEVASRADRTVHMKDGQRMP